MRVHRTNDWLDQMMSAMTLTIKSAAANDSSFPSVLWYRTDTFRDGAKRDHIETLSAVNGCLTPFMLTDRNSSRSTFQILSILRNFQSVYTRGKILKNCTIQTAFQAARITSNVTYPSESTHVVRMNVCQDK